MKSKKRFLSLFLALVMVVTVLPLNVFAEVTGVNITSPKANQKVEIPKDEETKTIALEGKATVDSGEATDVTWTIKDNESIAGVTLSGTTLTITSEASPGSVTLVAKSDNFTKEVTIILEEASKVTYEVSFNLNGGDSNGIASQQVIDGESAEEPTAAPTRTGYTFKGWFIGDTEYDFSTKVTTNITLTAKWEKEKYTVTFNPNNGEAKTTQEVAYEDKATKPTNPTRTGYTFKGWFLGNTAYDFSTKVTTNITLNAKWEKLPEPVVKYTVSFNLNGGDSEPIDNQEVVNGGKATKPTNPTRTGYTFKHWELNNKEYKFTEEVTSNIVLKAIWEKNESAPYVSSARLSGSYIKGKATPYSTVYFYRNGSDSYYDFDRADSSGYYSIYVGSRNIYSNDYVVAKNSNGTSSKHYISNWNWDDNDDPIYDRDKRVYPSSKTLNWAKDVVEGRLSDYKNTKVSVYDGSTYVGSGYTDSDGDFKISLNRKIDSIYDLKFYVNSDDKSKEDRIYPWSVKTSSYSVKGYYHPYTTVKAYYDGYYIGSDKTDSDGYFTISSNRRIYNDKYLKFYSDDAKDKTTAVAVTSAKAGEAKITGVAADYATITVKDSNGNKLGKASADKDGKFTLYTTRTLKPGEKLTIVSSETGKSDYTTTYTVTGVKEGDLVRIAYIKGYPDGNFNPKWNMTRAEAAAMFGRLLNGSDNFGTSKVTKFSDANDQWYSQAINYVVGKNLISGYPDGTFKPNEKITRAEFAKMISGYVKAGYPGSSNFSDVKGHWASDAIEKVYGNKVVKGYPDGTFKPNQEITRAEAVTILNSVFGRVSSNTSIANASNLTSLKTFRDVRPSDWFYSDVIDASNAHKSYRTSANDDTEIWTSITN
ncbi:MAG: InlB B-repeat-containing protein [Peptoniphilaceae bacterium]